MVLSANFLHNYKTMKPQWGYGGLGEVVYLRTYSRPTEGGTEAWWETVARVVEGTYAAQHLHCEKNGLPWSPQKARISAQKMYDMIFNHKFLPPGRGLWAMGTQYVEERGSAALNNCAFVSTEDIKRDFAYPFCFLMDMSMLGVGVGSDTRGAGTVIIKQPVDGAFYYVEDSREGWVDAVRTLLNAYVGMNPIPVHFDVSKVRPAGAAIKRFGGISSGPAPLVKLFDQLKTLYDAQIGKPITSSVIVDTFNMIGRAVVAGGVRRTAEIMLGDVNDNEFLQLKDPTLHPDALREYRWASNNSLITPIGTDYTKYVDQIMQNGEPGFFWLSNAQHYRRMKDHKGDWDIHVLGQNPCGEISLESGELCNLVEVYPAKHDSMEDFMLTLKWAYLYAKTVSLIPTHNKMTNAIIGRNRRLGVSVSGVTQALMKFGPRRFFHMLDEGYKYLRQLDRMYSRWLCVPESIKLTTVKPSGTVSLLAGSTPGVHFPHAEYYNRNVRFDPLSPLLPVLEKAGYKLTPSVNSDNTIVVSFPVHEEHFVKSKADVSIWEQFELAAQMQCYWADNSVSVTVTVDETERKDLATALALYESRLKSVSLLPLNDHGYQQAPYEEIGKEEYEKAISSIRNLNTRKLSDNHDIEDAGCTNDVCSII